MNKNWPEEKARESTRKPSLLVCEVNINIKKNTVSSKSLLEILKRKITFKI